MEIYSIVRRSSGSAEGDPVILRETKTTRLVFRPFLINNEHDCRQSVNGDLVFQRKSPKDQWEDHNELPLSKLKATEWIKVSLDANEIRLLIQTIDELRDVYADDGLPRSRARYLRLEPEGVSATDIHLDTKRLRELGPSFTGELLANLLDWTVQVGDPQVVLAQLQRLNVNNLRALNSLVGLTTLKNILNTWEANQDNASEEFWQKTLQENAFVLSQVFSFPILIIQTKAYIGGKQIDNTRGHLADFLAANPITRNAVIVEIKTPETMLLGRKYRADVYSPSDDLSGAVNQALNYRYNLSTDFLSVTRYHEDKFDVFNIQCLVIAGHAADQLQDDDQKRSFELIRHAYKDVLVIAYDELFHKIRQLIEALEGGAED